MITISGLAFSPLKLQVQPGDTVTVQNKDAMQHTVTSEAAPNAFTHSAVAGVSFDTGFFTGTATFTIPASAPVGTVIPYYCRNHTSTMATPTGEIDVVASVSSSPTPTPTPAPPATGY
ncbi:MAG TPA: plastocyanin/azurin family copper-binding protein [Anaeromyxobacteraceae bacterium]|nr:plastocyanin/azurin family copper-binding protein [Anaeromyxobacteraceae bacterium]